MKIFKKQKNISNINSLKNRGFTLIETMVAVLILSTSLTSLLTLTSSSLFAAKYANNEITANYLLQEAVDYIRNDRDSIVFQQRNNGDATSVSWNIFLAKYGYINSTCFSPDGCYLDITEQNSFNVIRSCTSPCTLMYFDPAANHKEFYTYSTDFGLASSFRRKITMRINPTNINELLFTVTVDWKNGNLSRSRSLNESILNWQN